MSYFFYLKSKGTLEYIAHSTYRQRWAGTHISPRAMNKKIHQMQEAKSENLDNCEWGMYTVIE